MNLLGAIGGAVGGLFGGGGGGAGGAAGVGGAGQDPSAELSATFDKAIETQKKLQQVQIEKQPQLDAAKEKPR